VQRQAIGVKWKIQLCISGQIIFVCKSERNIKIGPYLRKLCSNEKGPVFYDSQCIGFHCETIVGYAAVAS